MPLLAVVCCKRTNDVREREWGCGWQESDQERKVSDYVGVTMVGLVLLLIWYFFSLKPLVASENASHTRVSVPLQRIAPRPRLARAHFVAGPRVGGIAQDAKAMGAVFAFFTKPISALLQELVSRSKELTVHFKIIVRCVSRVTL